MEPTLLLPCHKVQQNKSWTGDEADPATALPQGAAKQEVALLLPDLKGQQQGMSWTSDKADPAPTVPQGA